MKKITTLLAVIICYGATGQTSIDTSGGRYWNEIFPNVSITSDVVYGSAVNVSQATQSLTFDWYEPVGDTVQRRPLLVFAHGGSFIYGSKTDPDVTALCTRFAKMGYACASINYRLGTGFPIDSINAGRAVIRATQDMKAAVRFFRHNYTIGNIYRIHPDYIFAGGSSAGAFMALHLAYLDSAEAPAFLNVATLGGLEGQSGSPGYPSNVAAVINLCGALGDSSWIQPGDISFMSMHGDQDQTVPYGSASVVVFGIPVIPVDGSSSLHVRANNIGVYNPLYTWWGADHVPYVAAGTASVAYMDTTIDYVKSFLRPYFGGTPVGLQTAEKEKLLLVSPNPASDFLTLYPINPQERTDVWVSDMSGRIVLRRTLYRSEQVDVSHLSRGLYTLRYTFSDQTITRKLVLN